MSTIKKSFEEIYNLLVSNKDKKVSSIMNELLNLMETKQRDSNHRFVNGKLEIFCYYHKEWELLEQVEYGSKANSTTGYNTMCKVGVNCWTKQQRDFKTNKSELLDLLANGKLEVNDLKAKLDLLELEKDKIVSLKDFHHDLALMENDEETVE